MAKDHKYGDVTVENEPGTPLNGTDEPVFILRAQDQEAMPTIARYINRYRQIEDPEAQRSEEFFTTLDEVQEAFRAWQTANRDKMKLAD